MKIKKSLCFWIFRDRKFPVFCIICIVILTLILASLVSASSSEKIAVSVFVKAKIPENKTNSTSDYIDNYLNFSYSHYKILINTFINLMNK